MIIIEAVETMKKIKNKVHNNQQIASLAYALTNSKNATELYNNYREALIKNDVEGYNTFMIDLIKNKNDYALLKSTKISLLIGLLG